MSTEKSPKNGQAVSYKIENFEKVDETIRIAFLVDKKRKLRLNGLPALLSGMAVGGVTKVMLEAMMENGAGLSKEQCTVIMLSINKLLIQLNHPNLKITELNIMVT